MDEFSRHTMNGLTSGFDNPENRESLAALAMPQ